MVAAGVSPGDQQAVAQVELRERPQVPVTGLPGAAVEVAAQALDERALPLGGQEREHRDVRAHDGVEVRVRPPPEGVQEAVRAVVRDRHGLDPHGRAAASPPSAATAAAIPGRAGRRTPGRYSRVSHERSDQSGSKPSTTTRRATRRSSRSPATGSSQWWTVSTAIAASKASSANGSASAAASTTGVARRRRAAARCARIVADGSTAVTSRPGGS